jgi:2,4-diketo-3-deoxy-L-fuconate hydrolase
VRQTDAMTIALGNRRGRATLLVGDGAADLEHLSGARFSSDPMDAIARWDELADWAAGVDAGAVAEPLHPEELGPPVPRPRNVFGIALNYRSHAQETGAEAPEIPSVFTKFPSCLAGPTDDVVLPSDKVDWEVELVVVMGRGGRRIPLDSALEHVAGFCVGQDFSERRVQLGGGARPQFSLGKSFDTFGPFGPAVVSLDAVPNPDDLGITCDVNGEKVQDGRTSDLIFSVPELVAYLSGICTLEPGDLIFTGTPSGVGVARRPPRFLQPGDLVVSTIEGVGSITNRAVAGSELAGGA